MWDHATYPSTFMTYLYIGFEVNFKKQLNLSKHYRYFPTATVLHFYAMSEIPRARASCEFTYTRKPSLAAG